MTLHCENCGKPVLAGDSVCWHCGWQLTPQATAVTDQKQLNPEEIPDKTTPVKVLVYGGLTAVLLLALLGVMVIFSRTPVIALGSDTRGAEWAVVDGPLRQFTLDLPTSWEWETIPAAEGRARYEQTVAEGDDVATAVAPFGPLAPDTELRLLATNADAAQPGVLVVVQSDRLSRLTVADALEAIETGELGDYEVLRAASAEGLDGREHAQIMLRYNNGLRCVQRFVPVGETAFVASACAPDERYPLYSIAFDTILDSFQTLFR